MNFLELAQNLRSEAGLSGSGPASVVSQTGINLKCVDWINDAWYEIQSLVPTWHWMWRDDGLVTLIGNQRAYDLVGLGFDVGYPVRDSFKRRINGAQSTDLWMDWDEYQDFRQKFLVGAVRTSAPCAVTIDPAGNMQLDPIPDSYNAYEVRFEYYAKPSFMAANTDVPSLPLRFHKMIVYRALMKYAAHDGAPEVLADAKANYEMWERRMQADQTMIPVIGGTLA
jgi:hypothetical protein